MPKVYEADGTGAKATTGEAESDDTEAEFGLFGRASSVSEFITSMLSALMKGPNSTVLTKEEMDQHDEWCAALLKEHADEQRRAGGVQTNADSGMAVPDNAANHV